MQLCFGSNPSSVLLNSQIQLCQIVQFILLKQQCSRKRNGARFLSRYRCSQWVKKCLVSDVSRYKANVANEYRNDIAKNLTLCIL